MGVKERIMVNKNVSKIALDACLAQTELLEGIAGRILKGGITVDDLKLSDQGNGWKKISFYYRLPPKRN